MKQLKFYQKHVQSILDKKKTTTWRIFDEKDLQKGDEVEFLVKETLEPFAKARFDTVYEKKIKDFGEEEHLGHEPFKSNEELLNSYKEYYGDKVTEDTLVKIIRFTLL